MDYYAGIDVSLELSSVCILDASGQIVREAKVTSEPQALATFLASLSLPLTRIGLEAGSLSQWLHAGLVQAGFEVVLLETRHVKAALSAMIVKTDRRDARGIAQLLRMGWFRPVHCKSPPAQEVRALRQDGTFSRSDFRYDPETDTYTCPEGKTLTTSGTVVNEGTTRLYRGSTFDCGPCPLKERCCPNTPARKIPRSIYEHAREAARALAGTPAYERSRQGRKRIEMLFAHLKRILKMGRLRLRGPCGAQDEFLLAATAQNLRKLAKLVTSPGPQVIQGA